MSNQPIIVDMNRELFEQFTSLYTFSDCEVNPRTFQENYLESLYPKIFLVDSKPVGACGATWLWDGVCEVWFLGTPDIKKFPLFLVKSFRRLTDNLRESGFRRVQIVVEFTAPLIKWASALGFTFEGVLSKYNINGADCAIFSKTWD